MTMVYPWQIHQWEQLLSQHQQQRLPHALLFTGAAGVGKYDFAKALAALVLCDNPASEKYACGKCKSCQWFAAGSHPDLYDVGLVEKSKVMKVDQIRELCDKLSATSHRGGHQVAIIYPAETMHRAAANALLKTLEEPAGQVLIILVSHQAGSLPATIVSRCQQLALRADADEATLAWLSQQLPSGVDAQLLLAMAENAPLRALAMSKQDYLSLRDGLLTCLYEIRQRQIDPLASISQWLKQDLPILLHALFTLVSDIARLQLGAHMQYVVNKDRLQQLSSLAKTLSALSLQDFIRLLQEARRVLAKGAHINVQLLLERVFVNWSMLRQ